MTEAKIMVDGHPVSITPKMFSFMVSINQSEYEVFCKDEDHNFAIARIAPHTDDEKQIDIIQRALDIMREDLHNEAWQNGNLSARTDAELLNEPGNSGLPPENWTILHERESGLI